MMAAELVTVETEASTSTSRGLTLTLPDMLYVSIDGHLQCEETKVDVRFGPEKVRCYVRWILPTTGFEFDGRRAVKEGQIHRIQVFGGLGDVVRGNAKCIWFAVGQSSQGEWPHTRAIFEFTG